MIEQLIKFLRFLKKIFFCKEILMILAIIKNIVFITFFSIKILTKIARIRIVNN